MYIYKAENEENSCVGRCHRNGTVHMLFGPKIKVNIWMAGGGNGGGNWGRGKGGSFLSRGGEGVAVVRIKE
jgi:hypothetical protein